MNLDRASGRIDDARELDQGAVAGAPDDPAVMARYRGSITWRKALRARSVRSSSAAIRRL